MFEYQIIVFISLRFNLIGINNAAILLCAISIQTTANTTKKINFSIFENLLLVLMLLVYFFFQLMNNYYILLYSQQILDSLSESNEKHLMKLYLTNVWPIVESNGFLYSIFRLQSTVKFNKYPLLTRKIEFFYRIQCSKQKQNL